MCIRDRIEEVASARGSLDGFDVAVVAPAPGDPHSHDTGLLDVPGVTWAVHMYPPDVTFDRALAAAKAGPSTAS